MTAYTYEDGRVWFQNKKFTPYTLLLPYGFTDVTDPTGALNAVREPSPGQRRETVVTDVIRGEPGLPSFSLATRMYQTRNYLLGMKTGEYNFQAHMGQCGRPDRYDASQIGLQWEGAIRGDLSIDRLTQLQGDNAPDAVSVPFSSKVGPLPVDFLVEFVSARTIAETEDITDLAFITDACDDVTNQFDPGDVGYAVTKAQSGSPANEANVWYTQDAGETWAHVAPDAFPFEGGEDISSVVVLGEPDNHRVIVARGTTDGSNPAEIAYAQVTSIGTVNWVYVNVGSTNGQYITYMHFLDWAHVFAVTDDGYVYRSADGGATWTAKLSTAVVQLNDIQSLSDGTVWIGGNSGYAAISEDFGDSWDVKTVLDSNGAAVTDAVTTVAVTHDGTAFAGTDAGNQYGTYDDGVTWTTLPLQGVSASSVQRIRAVDNTNIWAIANLADGSGRVLRSTDGGATFLLWSLNVPTNSGLNALTAIDLNYVFIGGDAHSGTGFISKTNPLIIGLNSL